MVATNLKELLYGATEHVLGKGGDTRLVLDAVTGLNAYGCSSLPRPWAVTFASSTASSISERGYAAADKARARLLSDTIERGDVFAVRAATDRVRAGILVHYGLPPSTRIALVPSGTDAELAALALAWLADPKKPIVNVLVAPEETGTGVPLAAKGRHFATLTARGIPVTKGDRIDGFPGDVELAEVPIRDANGVLRSDEEIDAACARATEAGLARGARVLFHVMDQSKTGRIAPSASCLERLKGDDRVDVVIDACQARLTAASVQRYFDLGHIVLITGSKFFTGPPFAGALLLPPRIAARLDGAAPLPAGLADYFGRFDWPEPAAACTGLADGGNVGLALRWEAALAEMRAFAAVPPETVTEILEGFARTVRGAFEANPDLRLHDVPALTRAHDAHGWDTIRTIFAFSIRAPSAPGSREGARLLDVEEAARVYAWLNSDISAHLAPGASEADRGLAARLFHLGQPVAIVGPGGAKSGALRISAGARLVSGEPSHAGLAHHARIESELADALAALAKVSLVLRNYDTLRAANPRPRFRGGVS